MAVVVGLARPLGHIPQDYQQFQIKLIFQMEHMGVRRWTLPGRHVSQVEAFPYLVFLLAFAAAQNLIWVLTYMSAHTESVWTMSQDGIHIHYSIGTPEIQDSNEKSKLKGFEYATWERHHLSLYLVID